jgi:hypothetical protein
VRQVAFIFSEENNLDFKQSVQDSFRFALYSCISGNHTLSCLPLAGAIESFSKGLGILEELEEKTFSFRAAESYRVHFLKVFLPEPSGPALLNSFAKMPYSSLDYAHHKR